MPAINLRNIYQWPRMTQLGVFWSVFFIAFYMGYLWDLSDLRTNLADSKQQEVDLKEQMARDIHKELLIRKELTQYPKLQAELKQWQAKLIKFSELPELLNEILKIGAANHLYFNWFDPEDAVIEGPYTKVPVKVRVVGSYQQIGEFISQIANMPTIVVIGDFSMTSESRNDMLGTKLALLAAQQGLLVGEFSFLIYHLTEKEAHGA